MYVCVCLYVCITESLCAIPETLYNIFQSKINTYIIKRLKKQTPCDLFRNSLPSPEPNLFYVLCFRICSLYLRNTQTTCSVPFGSESMCNGEFCYHRCLSQKLETTTLPRQGLSVLEGESKEISIVGGSDSKEYSCNAETQVRSLGQEDPLEKEMATHCSILAWRIPWTEEPGGLQSRGLQRVGQDGVTIICLST